MKKYAFTNNKKIMTDCDGVERELTQIVATEGFIANHGILVPRGKLGGWVQQESNLSQEGKSWLNENSYAFHDSMIGGNAYVDNSRLYHEVTTDEDSYTSNSKLHGKTLVCGDANIDCSLLFGDTTLAGYAKVENSSLTNVRLLVGSKDRDTWNTCHFENVFLKSEDYLIEFLSDVDMKDVHLSGKKIKVEKPIFLERVHGESIQRILLKQELEMRDVLMKENTSLLVKGDKKTVLIGNPMSKQGESLVIDSTGLILKNADIRDRVQIWGHWIVSSSEITGDVFLHNESDRTHILEQCKIAEYAKVTAQGAFDNAKTVTVQLSMDDEHEIT